MNQNTRGASGETAAGLVKIDCGAPALLATGPREISIRAGTIFNGVGFVQQTAVPMPELAPGTDYGVMVDASSPRIVRMGPPADEGGAAFLGGFHFAPGGNALARSGGDDVPAINPCSLWDVNFRPACPDPRGMALVDGPHGKFWADIYLLAQDHLAGTSRHGVTIADGDSPPQKPGGGRFKKLDFGTAVAVMKHHGKGLLGLEEFFAAAYGVTEKRAHDGDPVTTRLDAPRTSKYGLIQATGNLWIWGHDGDPDLPRASFLGGSWWSDGLAGSRCAGVAVVWPGDSDGSIGARGRGDHLQLAQPPRQRADPSPFGV